MRNHRFLGLLSIFVAAISIISCATRKQNQEVRRNLFDVQTRLLEVERSLKLSNNKSAPMDRRIASVSADFDQLNEQLVQLKGKINTLEVGVSMGHLPGQTPGEGSIAKRVDEIEQRIVEIEQTQKEILELISKKKSKKRTVQKRALKNLTQVERAFSKKRYKEIIKYGPLLLQKQKGADQERMVFLVAESYYKMGDISKAALRFHEFLDREPKLNVAHTKMRLGDCYRHLGDKETASIYYQELIEEFPSSSEAKSAEKKIAKIKNPGEKKI